MPLNVAGAYHSRLMASAQPRLEAALATVTIGMPGVPVISNVTAAPHTTAGDIRRLLVAQVASPVRWEASMRRLLSEGFRRFVELGPGTVLAGFMKRIDPAARVLFVNDGATLAHAAGAL
jgi:[acyl-carrier-protein] S-malonyltransferase